MLIKRGKRGQKSVWECDLCSQHFLVTNARATESLKRGANKYCSRECYSKYQSEVASFRVTSWVEKNGHPRLVKGSGVTTDGYVWIHVENEGKQHNQVKVHRYLMEAKLGRMLNSNEIVHHKDGNKLNNALSNLEIHTISSHNVAFLKSTTGQKHLTSK